MNLNYQFEHHDRFDYPDFICRVTAGYGGEALLIFGEEKTALYDCGMAYCAEGLIKNVEEALTAHERDTLDYVLMSHTHYDHIGALPYILKRWHDVTVCGASKSISVFQSEGARKTMKRLGENARDQFCESTEPVLVDGLRLDRVVGNGDRIELGGNAYFEVLETKGHTDCSLSYLHQPSGILFSSESTGVLHKPGEMHTAVLKSYEDTINAAELCRTCGAKQVISPHYGILPKGYADEYFDLYVRTAEEEKNFILTLYDKGLDFPQIMEAFEQNYWVEERAKGQPKAAFLENAKYTIHHILEVFRHA